MNAQEYWLNELSNRSPSTREHYTKFLGQFCKFIGGSPDDLVKDRKTDLALADPKEQRRIESELKGFIAFLDEKGFSTSTQQVAYAAVRSFFEIHYQPLRMRRGDYPSGESLGSRVATKEDIRILTEEESKRIKAVIYFLKDTGLRVSDAVKLRYRDVVEGLEKKEKFIPLFLVTKKNRTVAKTFIGPEAINALKDCLDARRKGTRRLPPENINLDSPLFRTRTPKVRALSRSGLSSLIHFQSVRRGINTGFSAHSLRKFFQTSLEAAGINSNWIDQMLGHKLINSRDAYSLPSDQQLKEAYIRAYPYLAVIEPTETAERLIILERNLVEKDAVIEALLKNGASKDQRIEALEDDLGNIKADVNRLIAEMRLYAGIEKMGDLLEKKTGEKVKFVQADKLPKNTT